MEAEHPPEKETYIVHKAVWTEQTCKRTLLQPTPEFTISILSFLS